VADASGGSGRFRFRLLGDFRMQAPLAPCDLHISGKTSEALAFLVLNANKAVRRATLSNLIWGDRDDRRSRANLNTALWRINRALRVVAGDEIALSADGNQVKLTVAAGIFVDVFALEACVRDAARSHQDGGKPALLPHIRDTLTDILSDDCQGFLESLSSEWVLVERERFFNLQIRGLTLLMQDLAEGGRIEEALDYGRRILRMDPMRECVQRQVMWLHVLSGHQGNAIRQYQDCVRILKDELGVPPMAETRALYEFIVARRAGANDTAPVRRWSVVAAPAIGGNDRDPGGYDAELTSLRSLMSRLNDHRHSVFAALAETS
jgi:DNA-binding SARP family transcriptional activator